MARLLPSSLPPDAPRSERLVHASLATLPDSWTVLWNIPIGLFGGPRRGLRQIDFLVIHPRQGLIVLEVKGGEVSIREGVWYTRPRNQDESKPLARSPFEQAEDQRFQLQRYLGEHLRVPRDAFSHAVALPDVVVTGPLGPNAPAELTLDARDLSAPGDALRRITAQWNASANLSAETTEKIVALLKPNLEATVVLAATAAATEAGLERETRRQVELVEGQVEAFEELLRAYRAVVVGSAGTGKTVLAVERARRLADAGQKTLLLCHRAAVFAFLTTLLGGAVEDRKYDPKRPGNLHVAHLTGLLRGLSEARGIPEPSPQRRDLAEWLLDSADELDLHYDALVIDEAQEFPKAQASALTWLLTDPEEAPLYLFADPFQFSGIHMSHSPETRASLRKRYRWTPPIPGTPIQLVHNCRNSLQIAALAESLYPLPAATASVEGSPPEFLHAETKQDVIRGCLRRVGELISEHHFRPNQILLVHAGISRHEMEQAANRQGVNLAPAKLVYRYPLTPKDVRVTLGTPDEVQGLEAEVVVLAHWQQAELQRGDVRDLYVAATRARSILLVVSNLAERTLLQRAMYALEHQDDPEPEGVAANGA